MNTEKSHVPSLGEIIQSTLFHGCAVTVWIIVAVVLVAQFSHPLILLTVIPLVIAGYFGAVRLSRTPVSTPAVLICGLALYILTRVAASALTWSAAISSLFGTKATYILSEALFWSVTLLLVTGISRFLSMKNPLFLSFETVLITLMLTTPFWTHRMGYINRPLSLIDRTWYYGIDPRLVFMIIGTAICLLLFFVISNRRGGKKSALDIILFMVIILILVLCIPFSKLQKYVSRGGGGGAQSSPSPTPTSRGSQGSPTKSPESGEKSDSEKEDSDDQTQMKNSASSGSEVPVAVVNFHDDYTPLDGTYYFRQTAYSRFNGIRLVKDTSGLADRDVLDEFPPAQTKLPVEEVLSAESDKKGAVETPCYKYLETTVGMIASHTRPFGLVNMETFTPMQNLDADRFDRIYGVGSYVRIKPYEAVLGKPLGSKKWDRSLWLQYTEAPTDPRYRELADRIVAEIQPKYREDPIVQALAIKLWLDENCTYSLSCGHAESPDPTASFLFGDRTGYCVYTAHAAGYLFRTLGIPSRLCGGYAVEARFRGGSSSLLILGKYSHLWPEIYIEGLGWVIIDITPKKSLEPPAEAPDQGLQSMMGEMVRKSSSMLEDKIMSRPQLKIPVRLIVMTLTLIIALLLAALYSIKLSRRFGLYFCAAADLPRAAYLSALDILGERGFLREFGETREAFAKRVRCLCPSFEGLTAIHMGSFFGKRDKVTHPRDEVLDVYNRTKKEASGKLSLPGRVMGILNPFSWLSSR